MCSRVPARGNTLGPSRRNTPCPAKLAGQGEPFGSVRVFGRRNESANSCRKALERAHIVGTVNKSHKEVLEQNLILIHCEPEEAGFLLIEILKFDVGVSSLKGQLNRLLTFVKAFLQPMHATNLSSVSSSAGNHVGDGSFPVGFGIFHLPRKSLIVVHVSRKNGVRHTVACQYSPVNRV